MKVLTDGDREAGRLQTGDLFQQTDFPYTAADFLTGIATLTTLISGTPLGVHFEAEGTIHLSLVACHRAHLTR